MSLRSRMLRLAFAAPLAVGGVAAPATAQQLERRLLPTDQAATRLLGVNVGTFRAGQTIEIRIEAENLQLGVRKFFERKKRGPWGIFGSRQVHRTIGNPVALWESFPLISLRVQKPHDDINAALEPHPDGDPSVSITASQTPTPQLPDAGAPGLSEHPFKDFAPETYAIPLEIAGLLQGATGFAEEWRSVAAITVRIQINSPLLQRTLALRDQRMSLAVAMPKRYLRGSPGTRPGSLDYASVSCDQVGDVGNCSTGAFRISLVSVNSDTRLEYVVARLNGEFVPADEIASSLLDWWLTRTLRCHTPSGASRPTCAPAQDAAATQRLAKALEAQLTVYKVGHDQDKTAKLRLLNAASQLDPGNIVLSELLVKELVDGSNLQGALEEATKALQHARKIFDDAKREANSASLVADWINVARASRNFADVVMRLRVGTLTSDIARAVQALAAAEREFDDVLRKRHLVIGDGAVLEHYASLISDRGRALLRTRTQADVAAARGLLGFAVASAPTVFDSTAVGTSADGTVLTFVDPRRFTSLDRRISVEQRHLVEQPGERLLAGLAMANSAAPLGAPLVSRSGGTAALFVSTVEIAAPDVPAPGEEAPGLKFRSPKDSPDEDWTCEIIADVPADRIAFAHRLAVNSAKSGRWLIGYRGTTDSEASGVRLLTAPEASGAPCTLSEIPIREARNPHPGAPGPETIVRIDWADFAGRHALDEAPLAIMANGTAWTIAWTDRSTKEIRIATLSADAKGQLAARRKGSLISELTWRSPEPTPGSPKPAAGPVSAPLRLESDDLRWFDTVSLPCTVQQEKETVRLIPCSDPGEKDRLIERVLSFSSLDDALRAIASMPKEADVRQDLREREALLAVSELVKPQGDGAPYLRLSLVGRTVIDKTDTGKGPTLKPREDCDQASRATGKPPAGDWEAVWKAQCVATSLVSPLVTSYLAAPLISAGSRLGRHFFAPALDAAGHSREIYVPLSIDGRAGADLVAFLFTPTELKNPSDLPIADTWRECLVGGSLAVRAKVRCFAAPWPATVANAAAPAAPAGAKANSAAATPPGWDATVFAPAGMATSDKRWILFARVRGQMAGRKVDIVALRRPQGIITGEKIALEDPAAALQGSNWSATEMDAASGPAHLLALASPGQTKPEIVVALPRTSVSVEIFSRRINGLPVADRLNVEFSEEGQAVAAVDQGSLVVIRAPRQRLEIARRPVRLAPGERPTEILAPLFVDLVPPHEVTRRSLHAKPVAACDDGTPRLLEAVSPAGAPSIRPCGEPVSPAESRPAFVTFNSQSERTAREIWYAVPGDRNAFVGHRAEPAGSEVSLARWPRTTSCRFVGLAETDIAHAILSPPHKLAESCTQLQAVAARGLGDGKWRWVLVPGDASPETELGDEQVGLPPPILDEDGQRQSRVSRGLNDMLIIEWLRKDDDAHVRDTLCVRADRTPCLERPLVDTLAGWLGGRRVQLSSFESTPRKQVFDTSTVTREGWLTTAERCVSSSQSAGSSEQERAPIPVLMGDRPLGMWRSHGITVSTGSMRPATYVWVAVSPADGGARGVNSSCSSTIVGVAERVPMPR